MSALCRDCLTTFEHESTRCPACRSPRLVRHDELAELSLAHIDCDAFFAAIEKRDRPELRDLPVIIGGGRRGVVSTCCYVARTYGVRSAMPMFKALAACPDAIVIKPDMAKYAQVGRGIRQRMLDLTPLVEPLSIDEAFLDLSGTARLHKASAAQVLARFARQVETEFGITVSVGLSYCKFLAKIASDLDKPRGFAVIGRSEAASFLADKPVSLIPGVGPATQKRLAQRGLSTIGQIAALAADDAFRHLGKDGPRLRELARGVDPRRVNPERETKSVSAETTFDHDIKDMVLLEPILWRLSERVASRMRKAGLAGSSVTLKLKTGDFRTRTRARSGLSPTRLAATIFETGRNLLAQECDGASFRLIGIGMSDLREDSHQFATPDLLDGTTARQTRTEDAIDALRTKFGENAVMRGIVLRDPKTRGR